MIKEILSFNSTLLVIVCFLTSLLSAANPTPTENSKPMTSDLLTSYIKRVQEIGTAFNGKPLQETKDALQNLLGPVEASLIATVDLKDPKLLGQAIYLLGMVKNSPVVVSTLVRATRADDVSHIRFALHSLRVIGGDSAEVRNITTEFLRTSGDSGIIIAACSIAGHLKLKEAVPHLLPHLSSQYMLLKEAVVSALGEIGPDALGALEEMRAESAALKAAAAAIDAAIEKIIHP